jgi:GNAT superfamily N-acetyltransferase
MFMVERQVDLLLVMVPTVLPVLIASVSNLKKFKTIMEPIVVSSKHRGQGIGKVLLSFTIEEVKKSGMLCPGVKPVAHNAHQVSSKIG